MLITGGGGYIGSHVDRQLGEAGENVVVLNNFSSGFASAGKQVKTPCHRSIHAARQNLMTEWMLRNLSTASSERKHAILHYFYVAGPDPEGRIGRSAEKATLLIKVACVAAVDKRSHVSIFGTDYPTSDITGVRVEDLVGARLKAW